MENAVMEEGECTSSVNQEKILTDFSDLDFEIEELDDKEYSIPPVENLPTLESILNEPDDHSISDEELSTQLGLFSELDERTSLSSAESRSQKSERRYHKTPQYGIHGSILRHVVLRGVSSQIQSASERINAGKPTAMAVSSLIAVGTFHGLVLIFDPKQVLKWCLGNASYSEDYGSVSALAFNGDCSRLLCGYARGQLTMWDLANGKLLRTITDVHPLQTAVLHVKFTDDPTLAVCSDSGGSVFELNFRRVMGNRTCESRCIFSGSRGEVCALEPLRMTVNFKHHFGQDVCLLALATVTKVIVVTIRPTLRVYFTQLLKANQDTLPVLGWQFVLIQISANQRVIDPVLAFGRQSVLYFYQVSFATAEKINFIPLQKMDLQHVVQNFMWLNCRTLVTMDTSEQLHLIDIRSAEELEVLDIGDVQLVYGTSHYKGLATGGNVSKAMAVAGERACFYSMAGFGSQLLLLGLKSVHVFSPRTWNERIDFLIKQNLFPEALAIAYSFYNDTAKAVIGLTGKKSQRKEEVSRKMVDVLEKYVDMAMTQLCPEWGKIEVLVAHYREVVPLCVDYCLALKRSEILFGKIFERFSADPIACGVFLESLESYILDSRLPSLSPIIAKEFVAHFTERQRFEALEACIVRLNITCLDIHQVMTLCWNHGLYDGIFYIYNRGMDDYTTPFEDLVVVLQEALETGKQLSDSHIKLGNKLLVYISCCLAGRAYPCGDIPPERAVSVKAEIFKCVTKLRSRKESDETVYPYLKTLLYFDTREFLNVLSLAFEEAEFSTEPGNAQKQRIVDILLQIMVQSEGFSPTQVGALFTFLARQIAKQENSIVVNRLLFEQVLEYLTNPGDETRIEERQQALMELLQAGGLAQVNEARLLTLAEKAKFFRVCEYLYEKRRQFDKILLCYLDDPTRKPQSFYYAKQVLSSLDHSSEEKASLESQILLSVQELVDIDNKKTSRLLLEFMPHLIPDVVTKLNDQSNLLYYFLQGLFSNREIRTNERSGTPGKEQPVIPPEVHEKYIELMCVFNKNEVHKYICSAEGYRLEETLEICRKHNAMDATAMLLERAGDIHGAFNILLEKLRGMLQDVRAQLTSNQEVSSGSLAVAWSALEIQLILVIQLCQRNSGKMDQLEREALWFPLLETMMLPQRQLRGKTTVENLEAFKKLTRHLLNSMMGYIALPAILQRILQTLLQTTTNLLNSDLHNQLAQLCLVAKSAFSCHFPCCNHCLKEYSVSGDVVDIVIFRCGHSYHINCIESTQFKTKGTNDGEWLCYLCIHGNQRKQKMQGCRISHKTRTISGSVVQQADDSTPSRISRKVTLNSRQLQALDYLQQFQRSPSRLKLLKELSHNDHS
ncbi:vacuolar protein sorting 8 isoform X2 [Tachypleus tridentatus]|uniref:vacuolar protein sorting 8 isoform X2 n=1 Tax=Tachypleus tridentatus TaxID=6853 RepID=UPI003FD587E6